VNKEHKKKALRIRKDNELMHPVHKSDTDSAVRSEYIQNLLDTPDFVKTYQNNSKKTSESLTDILKKPTKKGIIISLLFAAIFGGVVGMYQSDARAKNPDQKVVNQYAKDAAILLACVLAGLFVGAVTAVAFRQAEHEDKIDGFYHRILIRYFDKLRIAYPKTFDENVLKQCNPEMVRVITAIVIANMSESDTEQLKEIALSVLNINDTRDFKALKSFETDINRGLNILSRALNEAPELKQLVRQAYTGYIPKTFVLSQSTQIQK
jgi:hypothetical protein